MRLPEAEVNSNFNDSECLDAHHRNVAHPGSKALEFAVGATVRIIMPPPDDGNEYLPFIDLIKLDKTDELTYRSIALPFSPGGVTPGALKRSYGGHVYAQAAWAACQTVERGFLIYVCKLGCICRACLFGDIEVVRLFHHHKSTRWLLVDL